MSDSPYLNARREWLERHGDYIKQARNWRFCAILSLVTTIVSLFFAIYTHNAPQVEGFAVEYCSQNGEYYVRKLERLEPDEAKTKAALASWIMNLREVSSDHVVLERNFHRAFSLIARGSQAEQRAKEDALASDPKIRSHNELVEVEIKSILRQSEDSFQIDWIETIRNRADGKVKARLDQRAMVKISASQRVSARELLNNPLGIRIGEYRWTTLF
jgi:type IV secretion system protein TrbF